MLKEFKEFAMRGNLLDLAIGIMLGTAFGRIVTSFVNDVLMPPIGLLLGRVDFTTLFINLSGERHASLAAAKAAGAATINYGVFLNTVLDFIIVAFAMFLIIRQVNRLLRRPAADAVVLTKERPYCFLSISIKATRCPNCTSELKAP